MYKNPDTSKRAILMDKRTFGENKETKMAGYKWPGAIGHNHE
jgi:hypothetical protein